MHAYLLQNKYAQIGKASEIRKDNRITNWGTNVLRINRSVLNDKK